MPQRCLYFKERKIWIRQRSDLDLRRSLQLLVSPTMARLTSYAAGCDHDCFCADCRAGSVCTIIQSNLALHSSLIYHKYLLI